MSAGWDPQSPSLLPAMVCYADILGFRSMTEIAFKSGNEENFLRKIKRSLNKAYEDARPDPTRDVSFTPTFDVKFFTDNIVAAFPSYHPGDDMEGQLGSLLFVFALSQTYLAADGFWIRGGIAEGMHYQDEEIAYGPALLEAYDLDEPGKPPRLVIAPSVWPFILKHLSYGDSPHYDLLLEDPSDGQFYLNYLWVVFESLAEGEEIPFTLLSEHARQARKGLRAHSLDPAVRRKYEWIATYHNYVCRTFACSYQGTEAEAEAQGVLNYLVPIDVEGQPPRPLDEQRLKQRLE